MKCLRVETSHEERADDAYWLGFYLGRIVEKNWLIKNYGPKFIGRSRDPETRLAVMERRDSDLAKRESAIDDADTILRKYDYQIGVLTMGKFVEMENDINDEELVLLHGRLQGEKAISGNALILTTSHGKAKITYATMPETTRPNYIPGPESHAELELPAAFTINPRERCSQLGLV